MATGYKIMYSGTVVLPTESAPPAALNPGAAPQQPTCHCRWCSRAEPPSFTLRNKFMRNSSGADKQIQKVPVESIRTQKARGIRFLNHIYTEENGHQMRGFTHAILPETYLLQKGLDARTVVAYAHALSYRGAWRKFGRPCPAEPRHGFVGSRPVNNLADVQRLWVETRRADAAGEVMLQPEVDASWSAILTPNRITIGAGHDGATAGKGAIEVRLGQAAGFATNPLLLGHATRLPADAGVKAHEAPYFEFVYDQSWKPHVVQLRAGMAFPSTTDFVPRDVRVERVRVLSGHEDEMAWEAEAKRLGMEPGTVVYHPGGSVTSHFGVHCGINGVPYFISHEPVVGTTEPQACEDEPVHHDALRDGLMTGLTSSPPYGKGFENPMPYGHYDDKAWRRALSLGMFMLHNYNADHGEWGAWFLGCGAGWVWRGLAAACLGEYRHYINTQNTARFMNLERHHIYQWMLALQPENIIAPLTEATDEFLRGTHWGSGYGGLAWGRCGLAALRLYAAMSEFARTPNDATCRDFIAALNTAVNVAHNGGWVFNKFMDTGTLDTISTLARPHLMTHIVQAMVDALSVRAWNRQPVGARALGTSWSLDPEMVRYADSPDSIKRSKHPSGSMAVLAQEQGGQAFVNWFTEFLQWARWVPDCLNAPKIGAAYLTFTPFENYGKLYFTVTNWPKMAGKVYMIGSVYTGSATRWFEYPTEIKAPAWTQGYNQLLPGGTHVVQLENLTLHYHPESDKHLVGKFKVWHKDDIRYFGNELLLTISSLAGTEAGFSKLSHGEEE